VRPGVLVLAVVGRSGSGKTTWLERLIPELKRRGWRVGAVKHTHHTFDFDPRGKDSAAGLAELIEARVLACIRP
jgi:molybdopterin-guanine dinucleotide biosynthesis protein MobB